MMEKSFKKLLLEKARNLGFLDVGIANPSVPEPAAATYLNWVEAGMHGEMSYMERMKTERSTGVDHILPGARSVIVLAASYWFSETGDQGEVSLKEDHSRIARYALGKDYHYVLRERLEELTEWLENRIPNHQWRICVDSAPLLERTYAVASGIGFIGKNAMVISWMHGSYTFLAEILTTAEIEPDRPREGSCGNCTRCLDACPTQAFIGPGKLDARKCISYLTIEKKSELSDKEVRATGEWLFGCDICQQVCPYNKHPEQSQIDDFRPGTVFLPIECNDTFTTPQSNRQFEKRFAANPILRSGRRRVQKLISRKAELVNQSKMTEFPERESPNADDLPLQ